MLERTAVMLYTKKISDQSLLDRFHSLSFTMMVLWHEIVLLNFQSICEAEFFIERFFKWSFYFRLLFLKYFLLEPRRESQANISWECALQIIGVKKEDSFLLKI